MDLEIKIKHYRRKVQDGIAAGAAAGAVLIFLGWMFGYIGGIVMPLVILLVVAGAALTAENSATVITADEFTLRWKHVFFSSSVQLDEIVDIDLRPINVETTSGTEKMLRLTLTAESSFYGRKRIEFIDKLGNARAFMGIIDRVPLTQLAEYLHEKTGVRVISY